jgi:hypothetical protein
MNEPNPYQSPVAAPETAPASPKVGKPLGEVIMIAFLITMGVGVLLVLLAFLLRLQYI